LIDNMGINASAALFKDQYFIGINIGTYYLLEDLFLKINSFDSFGLSEDLKLNLINTNKGLEYNPHFDITIFAFDEQIFHNTTEIAQLLYRFIIYHEICHILRGHVGYISNNFGINIHEASNYKSVEINSLQTLEMDADSFATNRIINDYFENIIVIENTKVSIYKDLKTFLYNFAYCIYCFFRIFGFYSLNSSNVKSYSHPPPAFRINMIVSNIATILLERKIQNIESIMNEVTKAAYKAENDLSKITYFDNQFGKYCETFLNKDYEKYIFEITGKWQNIRPELENFTFCTLPK
ncbi:hypothetical protein, partial [Chryseobacterium gleum]|uniref:hypothetical protein n=1 Tax=Chryseobacterium gleum TaxID=250 RepID=UPI0028B1B828